MHRTDSENFYQTAISLNTMNNRHRFDSKHRIKTVKLLKVKDLYISDYNIYAPKSIIFVTIYNVTVM